MKILPAKVEQLSQGLCFTYMSQLTTRSREHSSSSLAGWSVSERQPCLVRGGERHGEEEEEEEEALRDQERNQEPVEIKEEEEELCSGQEGELLVLKLEADEESGPEPQADHQRLHQVAESRQHHDPDSGSTTDSEPEQRRHHNPLTGQTFFRCDVCGKDFKYQTTLQVHLRKHAGDEPNVCKLCGKDFQFGSRLKVHMRSHTGEKPYCCKSCGKTFGYRAGLIKHARVHTGEEES